MLRLAAYASVALLMTSSVLAWDPVNDYGYFLCMEACYRENDVCEPQDCFDLATAQCINGLYLSPTDHLAVKQIGYCEGMYGGNTEACIVEMEQCIGDGHELDFCLDNLWECQSCNTELKGCLNDDGFDNATDKGVARRLKQCSGFYGFCKDPHSSLLKDDCDVDRCLLGCSTIEDASERDACSGACEGHYANNCGACDNEFDVCSDSPGDQSICDGKYSECINCNVGFELCIKEVDNGTTYDSCIDAYASCKEISNVHEDYVSFNALNSGDNCYIDSPSRLLTGDMMTNSAMTHQMCANHCYDLGYEAFGVEWYTECFCGDIPDISAQATSSECNTPCQGDTTEMCGGGWRTNVFSIPINPSPSITLILAGTILGTAGVTAAAGMALNSRRLKTKKQPTEDDKSETETEKSDPESEV